MTRLRLLLVLAAFGLMACEQPSVDQDQVRRDDLVSTTWDSDEVNFTDTHRLTARFFAEGTVTINAAQYGTWKIKNNVFTLTSSDGKQVDVTDAATFDVTASHVYFNYLGSLCHVKPLGK